MSERQPMFAHRDYLRASNLVRTAVHIKTHLPQAIDHSQSIFSLKHMSSPHTRMSGTTAALFDAARSGCVDDAATALAFGANANARNAIGFTPLHYACWAGRSAVVKLLLALPCTEVDPLTPQGITPLLLAASAPGAGE